MTGGATSGVQLLMPLHRVPPRSGSWATAVAEAPEPCVLVDADSRIVAASPSWCSELGVAAPVGSGLVDLLHAVDFTARQLPAEPDSLPPVRALTSGQLVRGLVRLVRPGGGTATYDVVAVPLSGPVRGALAFFKLV